MYWYSQSTSYCLNASAMVRGASDPLTCYTMCVLTHTCIQAGLLTIKFSGQNHLGPRFPRSKLIAKDRAVGCIINNNLYYSYSITSYSKTAIIHVHKSFLVLFSTMSRSKTNYCYCIPFQTS